MSISKMIELSGSISSFLIVALILALISSCAITESLSNNDDKIENAQIYRSSGIERFFLSPLSDIGRVSELSRCLVPETQYFDFIQLFHKYGFSYQQSLSLQAKFNQSLLGKFVLNKKDYNQKFYESFEVVDSGASALPKVRSSKIFIVAIDSIKNEKDFDKLRKVLQERLLPQGQVALISRCMQSHSLEKVKIKHNLHPQLISIGAEFFTLYNKKRQRNFFWSIDLKELLPKKEIIYITTTRNQLQLVQGITKQWDFSNL